MTTTTEEEYLLRQYKPNEKYGSERRHSEDRFRTLRTPTRSTRPPVQNKTGLARMFSYTSYWDKFLIGVGVLSALVHGACWPLLASAFGEMTNTLVDAQCSFGPETHFFHLALMDLPTSASTLENSAPTPANLSGDLAMGSNNDSASPATGAPQHVRPPVVNGGQTVDPVRANSSSSSPVPHFENTSISTENGTDKTPSSNATEEPTWLPVTNASPRNCSFNIDSVEFTDSMHTFIYWYTGLGLAALISAYLQALCWQFSCEHQLFVLHQDFFYQVLRQDAAWFSLHQTKAVVADLINDLKMINGGIGLRLGVLLQHISTLFTCLAVGFCRQWQLTLVAVGLLPVLAVVLGIIGKFLDSSTAELDKATLSCRSRVEQAVACVRAISVWTGQNTETEKYKDLLDPVVRVGIKKVILSGIGAGFVIFGLYATYSLLSWYGVYLVQNGVVLDVGRIFTVAFCLMAASFSLGAVLPCFQAILSADSSAGHIFTIINTIPAIDPYITIGSRPMAIKGSIKFANVSFSRPIEVFGNRKFEMLRHANFTLKAGQTVALIGSDDCGKDLIKDLLFRFYDPSEGQVFMDGHDLRSLNVHWLRNVVGIVERDPVLFDSLVVDNMIGGLDALTFEEVVGAAKALHAHDFILSLPQGYGTRVGSKGVLLSAGVKQLIAMVRAFLRNPYIVLIEEMKAEADSECSEALACATDVLRKGRTAVIVAKHLSTAKKADSVIVLQDGWVVTQGTYAELLTQDVLCHYLLKNGVLVDDVTDDDGKSDIKKLASSVRKRRPPPWTPSESDNDEYEQKESCFKYLWKLVKFSCCEAGFIIPACFFAVVFGLTSPVAAYLMAEIFEIFTRSRSTFLDSASVTALAFLILAAIAGLSYSLRTMLFNTAGERLIQRLRLAGFYSILHQPLTWFHEESHQSQHLVNVLADDTLTSALDSVLGSCISMGVCLCAGIAMALVDGWLLATVVVVVVFVLLAMGVMLVRMALGKQNMYDRCMAEATQVVSEAVQKLWTVQALTTERRVLEAYVEKLTISHYFSQKQGHWFSLVFGISQGMMYFLYAGIFFLGMHLILEREHTPSQVIRVFFAISVCVVSLVQLLKQWNTYAQVSQAAANVFSIIELMPKDKIRMKESLRTEIRGTLFLKGLYFRYPSNMNLPILQGISLKVKPGQTIALVGPGSRAILELVCRIYDPLVGHVMIDNFAVHQLSLSYLRKNIAFITDPLLLPGTLYENIVYGTDENAVNSQVLDAAVKQGGVTEFLWDLPQGWKTVIGPEGITLRWRDQIRIALSRAAIRNPGILLVDDVFRTVIPEDLPLVMKAFRSVSKGRTTLVHSTAAAVLRSADWIVMLDKGVIVEQGKHEDLFTRRGPYYTLYHQTSTGVS